jgi:hypothetical protein
MLKVTSPESRRVVSAIALLLFASLTTVRCHAQAGRGGISGTVSDSTNAVVGGRRCRLLPPIHTR